MHTALISIIDLAMALGAGLRDHQFGAQQKFTGVFIGQACLGMRVMAIGTDSGVRVACRKGGLVHTIQYFLILFGVTLLAGGVHFQRKIARAAGGHFGVREAGDVRVTIHTGNLFFAMHGGGIFSELNSQGNGLTTDLGCHPFLLMTD